MPRGKRTRLEEGIYSDAIGLTAVVAVGDDQRERRFTRGTELKTLRHWRERTRVRLREGEPINDAPPAADDTLAQDVAAYLLGIPDGPSRANARILLGHWIAAGFGTRQRDRLTPLEIRAQMAAWSEDGVAPATVNRRRTGLLSFYRVLNGKSGYNPVREVGKYREPQDELRGFSYALVARILPEMPTSGKWGDRPALLAQCHAGILAYTGWPPAVIGRLRRRDLHLTDQEPWVWVHGRRKGGGTHARRMPITRKAVEWLERFAKLSGFGPVDTDALGWYFHRGVAAARVKWERQQRKPWPLADGVRPYDLRHAFGTETYLRTRNLQATADLMMHTQLSTTQRYVRAADALVSQQAVGALDRHFSQVSAGIGAGTKRKRETSPTK